jgi:protein-tyrosine phosphatase
MHAGRRADARRRLRGTSPRTVLFLCHGNVCRSPFAAAVLARAVASLSDRIGVASAGFIGPTRPPPTEAVASASRFGIDLTQHRSQLITPEAIRTADLVVVMSATQAQNVIRSYSVRQPPLVLGDLDPDSIDTRTIVDPWGGPPELFDASYARIERCVGELVMLIALTAS